MTIEDFIKIKCGRNVSFDNIVEVISVMSTKKNLFTVTPYMCPEGIKELAFWLEPATIADAKLINFASEHKIKDVSRCNEALLMKLSTIINIDVYEVKKVK